MKTVKMKIIVWMSAISAALLLVLGVLTCVLTYTGTTKTVYTDMEALVSLASERVQYECDAFVNVAEIAGMNPTLSDEQYPIEDRLALLDSIAKAHGATRSTIIDANGINVQTGADMNDREYFQSAMRGESTISEPLVSRVTGEMNVIIAAPLWENGAVNTKVVGCVYVVPDPEFLNNIMRSIQISPHCIAYMIDANGTTIADVTDETVEAQENIEELAKTQKGSRELAVIHEKARNGETGISTIVEDGVKRFICYAPVDDSNGWSILIETDQSDFMSGTVTSIVLTIVLIVVGQIFVLLIAIYLGRSIGRPISASAKRLSALARGDLESPVEPVTTKDETAQLAASTKQLVDEINVIINDMDRILGEMADGNFNVSLDENRSAYVGGFEGLIKSAEVINDRLSGTLSKINIAADEVSSGSAQVSAGAVALAQGTTEQAGSVEELAAMINEISVHIGGTSKSCAEARDNTNTAKDAVDSANGQMQSLVDAMEKINTSSDEIGDIIKTIEDIAFQTNILALNASIEAARAGEAGKGFAVVANEVGNLAAKSAEAANSTTALIEESIKATRHGSSIVNQTAKIMRDVSASTEKVTDLITKIASASVEQANSAEQIKMNIEQISSVIQMNSATAEQSAASAEQLSGQSAILKEQIQVFKLRN